MHSFKATTFLGLALAVVSVSAQVPPYGQCGGNGYTGSTTCTSGWTCTYSNEWYSQCLPSTNGGGTSTTARASTTVAPNPTSGNAAATPTGLTTTIPPSAGTTSYPTAIRVAAGGNFDGGMMKYDRNPKVCAEQDETGEADAMFILEAGATLSNVIIGPDQAEGVHCKGTCTLNNVWWLNVCEDGATFKQSSGTSYVNGGGAVSASDKVFQHNGAGTVSIKNFYVSDYGKLYRSCGNCSNNGQARHVIIDNVVAKSGGVLAGINTNYGDTARISNSCVPGGTTKACDRYQGTTSGEPSKIGSGPDGTYCIATNIREC